MLWEPERLIVLVTVLLWGRDAMTRAPLVRESIYLGSCLQFQSIMKAGSMVAGMALDKSLRTTF